MRDGSVVFRTHGSRVPLPWLGTEPPFGFSPGGVVAEPWLPPDQPIAAKRGISRFHPIDVAVARARVIALEQDRLIARSIRSVQTETARETGPSRFLFTEQRYRVLCSFSRIGAARGDPTVRNGV